MKIDSSFKQTTLHATPQNPGKAPEKKEVVASEALSLSPTATHLQAAEKPPVNSGRIQEIKSAIAQGAFKINPEAIADGLIETARELINNQRKA